MTTTPIQTVAADDVYTLLKSRVDGLTESEAQQRLRELGANELQSPSRMRWLKVLAKHFLNLFSILLDIAGLTCFFADWVQPGEAMGLLGWTLLGVSILNSLFSFAQEMRAERAMEELRKYLPRMVRVRRDRGDRDLPAASLVPGDVVYLKEGDRIPADLRIVFSEEMLVNNAPLTGESRSQSLDCRPSRANLTDCRNIAFAGCSVLRGSGKGVVFATGVRTEFGKIAVLSGDVVRPPSPIEIETNRMVRLLTLIAVTMGVLFFLYGVAAGRSVWVNIIFMLGIIVANVPEGLLPTFTLSLSMASLRMAKKNVLVKSLDAVEALGALHVICTDKTGTLTRNELAITAIISPTTGESVTNKRQEQQFLKMAVIASEVREERLSVTSEDKAHRVWQGDPLDIAVVEEYSTRFGPPQGILAETKRHFPFDLQKRREAGILANSTENYFAVKGAWEALRDLIGYLETSPGDLTTPVSSENLRRCDEIVRKYSCQGQRVIAVAHRRLERFPTANTTEETLEKSLVLAGFLALADPLRDEVPTAVACCQRAGIEVMLITGDHPDTAEAVAKQCGILPVGDAPGRVLVGTELNSATEEQLIEKIRHGVRVFARTTPEQKMKIVNVLKRLDYFVGMTGDGVNDAPALKAADVGIAMGASGTDVAREAADIVLLDDNFASIVTGVEEGRTVYANMQKFTTYVLASNVPEIVPMLIFVLFPVPLALTVIQILSIDIGTDLMPAIGLGQEPPEKGIMDHPPRRMNERLLSLSLVCFAYLFLGLVQATWSLFMFFWVLHQGGWHWGEELGTNSSLYRSATGITLATVVIMQIGNVISRRSLRNSGLDGGLLQNKLMLVGIAFEVLFVGAILFCSPAQQVLGTGPVDLYVCCMAWLGLPLIFVADYARKRLFK